MSGLEILPYSVKNTRLASRGQEITINIKPAYAEKSTSLPYAGFINEGSILLDSAIAGQGFTLVGQTKYEQTFSAVGQVLSWTLKAPQQDLTTAFVLKYKALPLDKNSGKAVVIGGDSASVSVPVRIRKKTITVTINEDIVSDTTFTQPTDNVPLLGFNISNADYDDNLYIKGLKLEFFSTDSLPLSVLSLKNMIKSISVADIADVQEALAKKQSLGAIQGYIDYQIGDTAKNPLTLVFGQEVLIAPHTEAQLVVSALFRDKVMNRSFRTLLRNVNVYDFDPQNPLEIIDSTGAEIAESKLLSSKDFIIVSKDLKDAFYNYPNPFGRTYEHTNIVFRLTEQSDVDIRIFTLVGGLVWTRRLQGLGAGLYQSLVRWDGRNDRGKVVLNGVYLCAIDIKPRNGGSKKRYITKIAFIK